MNEAELEETAKANIELREKLDRIKAITSEPKNCCARCAAIKEILSGGS